MIENNKLLNDKWILNLTLHFNNKPDCEKFFVTYTQ